MLFTTPAPAYAVKLLTFTRNKEKENNSPKLMIRFFRIWFEHCWLRNKDSWRHKEPDRQRLSPLLKLCWQHQLLFTLVSGSVRKSETLLTLPRHAKFSTSVFPWIRPTSVPNAHNKTTWNSDDFRSCYKVKTQSRFTETFAKVHQPVEWTWAPFQANLDWLMFSLNQHHLTFFATDVNLSFSFSLWDFGLV